MSRTILGGLSGANPLGFLAALGALRVAHSQTPAARLAFLGDGSFRPVIENFGGDIEGAVAADAAGRIGPTQSWWLEYDKKEKKAVKRVADLKAPPPTFLAFLHRCVDAWLVGDDDACAYAAAFGTSTAVDGKGNTKPTAFHFTAANQQFLRIVEKTRSSITKEWVASSLFEGGSNRPGSNLRWDPAAERNWALMANEPTEDGTSVDAPLEWLAFRGLALFPSFPYGRRIVTTAVDEMHLSWPLWSVPASLHSARSVLQVGSGDKAADRRGRGVFAMCTSSIRRTSQGFGNFGPSAVTT